MDSPDLHGVLCNLVVSAQPLPHMLTAINVFGISLQIFHQRSAFSFRDELQSYFI